MQKFVSQYGVVFVLVLLCAYYSFATLNQQHPADAGAGRKLARYIAQQLPNANVLIVVRDSDDDRAFAASIQQSLEGAGMKPLGVVAGEPRDVVAELRRLGEAGTQLDVIVTHQASAQWTVLGEARLKELAKEFPSLAGVQVIKPSSYTWPTFLTRGNLLSVGNQVAVTAIIAIAMTMVIITAGIDLSVGSIMALSGVVAAWTIHQCLAEADPSRTRFVATIPPLVFAGILIAWLMNRKSKTNVLSPVTLVSVLTVVSGVAAVPMSLRALSGIGLGSLAITLLEMFSSVGSAWYVYRRFGQVKPGVDSLFSAYTIMGCMVCGSWFLYQVDPVISAIVLGCFCAILLSTAIGSFNGIMVTAFGIPAFIVTLAVMRIARGLAYKVADGPSPIGIKSEAFHSLSAGTLLGIPNPVILMVVLYILAYMLMSHTALGRYIYAVGGNPEAARLSGVPVKRVLLFVYAICGALAGLGGVMEASLFAVGNPNSGVGYELQIIAAVVVGGTSLMGGKGKVLGTLIGALILAVISNGMYLTKVDSYTQMIVFGTLILIAVLLDQLKTRRWKF